MLKGQPLVVIPVTEKNTKGLLDATLKMIPYFAWANRDNSSMMVWYGTDETIAQIDLYDPKNTKFASVAASYSHEESGLLGMNIKAMPQSSRDKSILRWTSWPRKGEPQWFEVTLKEVAPITTISLYWYEENGGVEVPAEWHIETKEEGQWVKLPLYLTDSYSSLKDSYNMVRPEKKLVTDTFRIVMTPPPSATVGILSIKVITE